MSPRVRRPRLAPLLAFLAVALLTWAGVRSSVMQAAMAAPAAGACREMAGMGDMAGMSDRPVRLQAPAKTPPAKSPPVKTAACPWCAATVHAPLDSTAARPTAPVQTVTFAAYAAPRAAGPRGPPQRRPSARDPPRFSA